MPKMKLSILSEGEVKARLTWICGALLLAAMFVSSVAMGAAPTMTTYNWKAVDDDWSGAFNDPDHWDKGVPAASNLATIAVGQNATVTLPSGEYDTLASLKLKVSAAGSTLHGTVRIQSSAK